MNTDEDDSPLTSWPGVVLMASIIVVLIGIAVAKKYGYFDNVSMSYCI